MKNTYVTGLVVLMLFGCSGSRPGNLGVKDGKLSPCPDRPNCVSSQADVSDAGHYIDPLQGNIEDAAKAVTSMENSEIITQNENYLHAEFTSSVMRFVDDVEFFHDADANTLHVRSASRLGYSDWGVNRKRVEKIRKLMSK